MYNILIVEDEYLSREVMKKIIVEEFDESVEVIEASNGIKAKDIIDNNSINIDIVIMDTNIPGINGIELCKYIRAKFKNIPIIIVTGYDEYDVEKKIVKLNINEYLLKPVRASKIIEVIKEHLNKEKINSHNKENTYLKNLNERYINSYIKDVIKYVDINIKKNITLEEVASHINLSTHYLSKVFKKEVGVNFITYLTDRRIELAKEMLHNENIPIVNISIELSYSKPNYFSKVFKNKVGATPTEYREQCLISKRDL